MPKEPSQPSRPSPAAEANRLIQLAAQRTHPEDHEAILLEAAAQWELAGHPDRSVPLYDSLLAHGSDAPQTVRALRARALWDGGEEAEAHAAVAELRAEHPADLAPWQIIGELYESHDDLPAAAECYTAGASQFLKSSEPEVGHAATQLLVARHRVRRLMGDPHDDWDVLADVLHARSPLRDRAPVTLDELHDPKRVWALGSEDPAEVRAEIARLETELAERRAALSRPFPLAVLHWPEPEFARLQLRHPAVASSYGTYSGHLREVETALRDLSSNGASHVGIVTGTVPDYESYARAENRAPADPTLPAEFTADLAARGRAMPWPPPRNGPCWCGSPRTYEKCCGNPAFG